MTVRVLHGDCRAALATLPSASVHCCVTSPPYYRLRAYLPDGHADKPMEIGLEQTHEAYVAALVAVFREVRRVMRPDATCWLNVGSSYASGGTRATRSRQSGHVPACDSGGTEPSSSQANGRACSDFDGEYPAAPFSRTPDTEPPQWSGASPLLPIGHDTEPVDCGPASLAASLRASPASIAHASFRRDQDASSPGATASASPLLQPTSSPGSQASVHTSACTSGIVETLGPLARCRLGRAASGLACDCGSCGICWAYLAIPLLNFKPKDEIPIPHLVAMALQADGWFLRQTICWSKPNPMPESVRDRCTKAHEYVFLLSKSQRYYYDNDAISEPAVGDEFRPTFRGGAYIGNSTFDNSGVGGRSTDTGNVRLPNQTRNKRSVWTIATEPTSLGHFALMPSALAEVCIKAGTSERGCCPTCGAPWVREMEREREATRPGNPIKADVSRNDGGRADRVMTTTTTLGWSPSCACPAHTPRPCTVLDPFGGAGTTGLVADRLGRDAILIELSLAHAATARRRIEDDAGMFANVAQAAE